MPSGSESTSDRKRDHIRLCLTDEVSFKEKTNGFEHYEFIHNAITEVDPSKIDISVELFGKKIQYPFLISCMTGGTGKAENINMQLAEAAEELKIPIGMGSQRQALENDSYHSSYKIIRQKAKSVPVLGNIGAAQIIELSVDKVLFLRDLVDADAMVIHVNPLQELIQINGEPVFTGLLKKIEQLTAKIPVPILVKEVGSGISGYAAQQLLESGVKGIDTAGAGGTSWSGVEMLRNDKEKDEYLWDWGLPTSYCIRTISALKEKYNFILIGSGGINSAPEMAKAIALGADIAASARIVLMELEKSGIVGVKTMLESWFIMLRKIMYLTGSDTLSSFRKNKINLKGNLI